MPEMDTLDWQDSDALEYYVAPTELGWRLVVRRGAKLSLTQDFPSVSAAVARGLDIRSEVAPPAPAAR
jgi:hypothetical protein